ncbi:DUF4912 domain-containing protein [Petrotoga olearia]|uniref:Rho termination factor N-terminal domain-containing protein n=2 Tax=Petrotoga olearia TaxID=156203 RepID=A0A2K1P1F3_9BACT|nr:DUF4912 domain-containing protein [Petrotoga olearia]PNR96590.1 hypothetical protein X929_05380 [Petrotoga olearia DSM 13574]RMA76418.1 hypothetical protein C8D75_0061 [Petrotoga olearia]
MKVKESDKKLLSTFKADDPTIQELRTIAKNLGIKLKRNMNKKEILKAVRKEIKRLEEPSNQKIGQVSEYTKSTKNLQKLPKSNESEELPKKYEKDKLKLMPVNPHWAYAYWEFSEKSRKKLKKLSKNSNITIRVIKKSTGNQEEEKEVIETNLELEQSNNIYFSLPQDDSTYAAFLGVENKNEEFTALIESNEITTPSSSLKSSDKEEWFLLKEEKVIEEKVIKENKKKGLRLWGVEKHAGSSEKMFINKRKSNGINFGRD